MVAVWPACNGADGISDIEGKVARIAASKLGNERVSIAIPIGMPTSAETHAASMIAYGRLIGFIVCDRLRSVTATQIIEEIKRLDPNEQLGVIRFAYQLDAERKLTGKELSRLAERMVNTTDPAEQARVREEIIRGFYGQRQNA